MEAVLNIILYASIIVVSLFVLSIGYAVHKRATQAKGQRQTPKRQAQANNEDPPVPNGRI